MGLNASTAPKGMNVLSEAGRRPKEKKRPAGPLVTTERERPALSESWGRTAREKFDLPGRLGASAERHRRFDGTLKIKNEDLLVGPINAMLSVFIQARYSS